MKKFFVILGVVLAITGCGKDVEKKEEVVKVEKNISSAEKEIITFKREDNKEIITLESSNLFETGILTIGNKKIEMKEAVSGSGTRMIGENEKIEIHFRCFIIIKKGLFIVKGPFNMLKIFFGGKIFL